jgi:hypothetical protein
MRHMQASGPVIGNLCTHYSPTMDNSGQERVFCDVLEESYSFQTPEAARYSTHAQPCVYDLRMCALAARTRLRHINERRTDAPR